MGYAPRTDTGNDGLIVVDSFDKANSAIDLIIEQVQYLSVNNCIESILSNDENL
jgi:hypothetical protein